MEPVVSDETLRLGMIKVVLSRINPPVWPDSSIGLTFIVDKKGKKGALPRVAWVQQRDDYLGGIVHKAGQR